MISSYKTFFHSCFRDQRGSISTTFAFASVVLIGCSGVAVDYGRARLMHAQLQNNLDAAVLAGISGSTDAQKQIKTAQRYFDRWAGVQPITYKASFSAKNGTLTATASAVADTSLLRVLNINTIDVGAKSTATSGDIDNEPMCFMAMHPTRKHTLEMKGSVSVVAPDCHIYGNSNHEYDVVDPHTPDNFLTAKSVAAIGGGHHYLENVTPPVEFGTKLIADPLLSMSMPAVPSKCTQTGLKLSGKSRTLPDGRYCNGITIEKGSKITLQKAGPTTSPAGP